MLHAIHWIICQAFELTFWKKKKGKLRKIMQRLFLSVDLVIDNIVSIRRPAVILKIKWLTRQNAVSSRFIATKFFLVPKRPFSPCYFPFTSPKFLPFLTTRHPPFARSTKRMISMSESDTTLIHNILERQLYPNYIGNCKTYTSKDLFLWQNL